MRAHSTEKLIQFSDHDRQVRAVGIAEMAGSALLRSHNARAVFIRIHGKYLGRAEFDANVTAFAPGSKDKYFAARAFFGRQSHVLRLAWNSNNISHESPFTLGDWNITT
jgi:hypothetical protein